MNNSSRLKVDPERIFECFCEVGWKSCDKNGKTTRVPWIKRRFPDTYQVKEILDSVPKFAYPCDNLILDSVTEFSFVLTNIDSKWTFGYCRISPTQDTCIVLLSQLPWHETFFKIVAKIGSLFYIAPSDNELLDFLKALYQYKVPDKQISQLIVQYGSGNASKKHIFEVTNRQALASIPEDRNLTAYYTALNIENMITLFASALNERHILIVSSKLDKLSSCVQALNTLLWPMNWQHIFISVLPSDLLAYLQAPMPFLIGVPEQTFKKLNQNELNDVVLLLVDENIVQTRHDDVKNLPPGIASKLKSELKSAVALGDSVSRAFLRSLVTLIGGYREALEFNDGEKITFNHERFIATRPSGFQGYLKKMLELQMFRQFIEGRLEMLNAGQGFNDDFEFEVNLYEERTASKMNIQYQDWLNQMKTRSGILIRSINPSIKLVCRGIRDKSKQAYKDWKVKLNEAQSNSQSRSPSFLYSRME